MRKINAYTLRPDCKVCIGPPWQPPASILPRVDQIWDFEAKRCSDHLTNGRIYGLSEFCPEYLLIHPSEYRYVLARRRDPNLARFGLDIRPLAVTGILLCADGLVLGRRGSSVCADVGLWEPAPAGVLSREDPKAQVLEELEEELGIAASMVIFSETCGLVEDVESGVVDIISCLRTPATEQDVRAAYVARKSGEYAELAIVRPSDLPKFLETHSDRLLPALRQMLCSAGML